MFSVHLPINYTISEARDSLGLDIKQPKTCVLAHRGQKVLVEISVLNARLRHGASVGSITTLKPCAGLLLAWS